LYDQGWLAAYVSFLNVVVLLGKESGETGQEVDGKERQKGCILQ
jgi:hypothetical protein